MSTLFSGSLSHILTVTKSTSTLGASLGKVFSTPSIIYKHFDLQKVYFTIIHNGFLAYLSPSNCCTNISIWVLSRKYFINKHLKTVLTSLKQTTAVRLTASESLVTFIHPKRVHVAFLRESVRNYALRCHPAHWHFLGRFHLVNLSITRKAEI